MGLTQLKGIIDSVKRYSNHNLRISGLLLTKYKGTNANKAMMTQAEHIAGLRKFHISRYHIQAPGHNIKPYPAVVYGFINGNSAFENIIKAVFYTCHIKPGCE